MSRMDRRGRRGGCGWNSAKRERLRVQNVQVMLHVLPRAASVLHDRRWYENDGGCIASGEPVLDLLNAINSLQSPPKLDGTRESWSI